MNNDIVVKQAFPRWQLFLSWMITLGLCLPVLAMTAQGNPMLRQSTTRAVVVGISNYQHISKLEYAHRDAQVFADYLKSPAGGNVPEDHIRLLLNENATQMEVVMAMHWLVEESKEGDRAFIYFSGHGDVENKTVSQLGFLLTYDAPATTYMAGGAFPIVYLQDMIRTLSTVKHAQVVLFADACRAGKLAGNAIGGNHLTAEVMAEAFANEVRILSCQPAQLSQEDKRWGGGRGVFSYHLIDGLVGLANGRDGNQEINVMEIRRYLEDEVAGATDGAQVPMVEGPPTQSLVKIDAASLEDLIAKKSQKYSKGAVAMKKPVSGNADSTIWRLYLDFQQAVEDKHLLYPEEGAAYHIYQKIKDESIIAVHQNKMKQDLVVALHDEAQQAINDYLSVANKELRLRWEHNERYERYPEFLGKAAELLGPNHIMYENLLTRQLYFEGLRLRLQGEQSKNKDLYRQALQKQEQVLIQDPSAAYAYNELGLLYRRLAQKTKATRYFHEASRYSPTWVLPLANLVANFTDLNLIDSAIAVGDRAILANADFALTYHNLGYAYERTRNWPKVVAHYEKAIELDPEYADSYYNLGLAYYELKQYDKTEYCFIQYHKYASRQYASVWSGLGHVADLQHKNADAEIYFEKALLLDPEYPGTYLNLSEFYLRINNLDKAEQACLNYLEKKKEKQSEGHYMLAAILARKNQVNVALDQLFLAVDKGFTNIVKLKADENLKSLHIIPRFQELLNSLEEK